MSYTEHHYRSHDGLSLYYRDFGASDNVVLCLPGLTRNSKDFENLANHLSADWRVICPDFRGRGQSDWDPKISRYNPGTYAADVWTLLDRLDIKKFAVIGTSLGGMTAMIMADQQAHRLMGLVLNDIGPEVPAAAVARIMQYVGRMPPTDDWTAAINQARAAYEAALPGMPPEFWDDFIRLSHREDESGRPVPDMDPAIGDAARNSLRLINILRWLRRHGLLRRIGGLNIDAWDNLDAVTMPGLLLRGELSDVLAVETVSRMLERKPDLEVVTIPNRGHAPTLDEPIARESIGRFLNRLISAS